MAGRTPAMNALAAELGLRLHYHGIALSPEHFRGEINFECDALSRLSQGAQIPASLDGIQRAVPPMRGRDMFWAWPRDMVTEIQIVMF